MLKCGKVAPSFAARAVDSHLVMLSALLGTPLILYFFRKAFTPICTVETKGFRDNYPELKLLGFDVIGISTDSEATQCRFAQTYEVPFTLIADHDQRVTRSYDVKWPLFPFARRITYVLGRDHVIMGAFHHEFQANKHLDEVLRLARRWRSEQVGIAQVGIARP